MKIAFNCPACGNRFEVADNMAGQKGQCTCGSVFVIPGPRQAAAKARVAVGVTAPPTRAAVVAAPAQMAVAAPPVTAEQATDRRRSLRLHLVPCLLLLAACTVLGVHDLFIKDQEAPPPPTTVVEVPELLDEVPRLALQFHDANIPVFLTKKGFKPEADTDAEDRVNLTWAPSMRFGLVMFGDRNRGSSKRLTFRENGLTNNTCVRLDGGDLLFGESPLKGDDGKLYNDWLRGGRWVDRDVNLGKDSKGRKRHGRKSVWMVDEPKVQFTQVVEIVPGAQSRLLDTCVVRYQIDNLDSKPHKVGLRFMLDTYIGANDGVPFTIPGAKQLCDTFEDFSGPEQVPDFIQALERDNLSDPGTIAHIQFKIGRGLEAPDRATLGAWPSVRLRERDERAGETYTRWEVPVLPIKTLKPADSAVVMYWNEKEMQPNESRKIGFAYGLGSVSSSESGGHLALSVSGSFVPNGEFTLTGYVSDPLPGQSLTLTLPSGFKLVHGTDVQGVPPVPAGASSRNSPVTWKIKAPDQRGKFALKVSSSTGVAQTQQVIISGSTGIFD